MKGCYNLRERGIWTEAEKLTFEITSHKESMSEIAMQDRVKKCEEQISTCGNKISNIVDNLRNSQNGN